MRRTGASASTHADYMFLPGIDPGFCKGRCSTAEVATPPFPCLYIQGLDNAIGTVAGIFFKSLGQVTSSVHSHPSIAVRLIPFPSIPPPPLLVASAVPSQHGDGGWETQELLLSHST